MHTKSVDTPQPPPQGSATSASNMHGKMSAITA
jgi:hypothetical protein